MSRRYPGGGGAGPLLTMEVPNEVRVKYVEIIDDILSTSDLAQVTEKKIRNGIQDRVEYDITPQKVSESPSATRATRANLLGGNQGTDHASLRRLQRETER
jgi:hypothetical protein